MSIHRLAVADLTLEATAKPAFLLQWIQQLSGENFKV